MGLYVEILHCKFDVEYFDVRELVNISLEYDAGSDINNQFLNGRIDRAVENIRTRKRENKLF